MWNGRGRLGLEWMCWGSRLLGGCPIPSADGAVCVAVWTGEEGAELEEEVEEEEESGSLDEEEIKKLQSDEVCGDILEPFLPPPLQSPSGEGVGNVPVLMTLFSTLLFPP